METVARANEVERSIMREILFKAKQVDNGEWVEGYFVKKHGIPFIYENAECPQSNWEIDENTLCQYTGFTDRAKNKSFENSIVKLISENVFGVVKFGEYSNPFDTEYTKHIGFYVEWLNSFRCSLWRKNLGYWLNANAVVVGNVFDNPELLGGV